MLDVEAPPRHLGGWESFNEMMYDANDVLQCVTVAWVARVGHTALKVIEQERKISPCAGSLALVAASYPRGFYGLRPEPVKGDWRSRASPGVLDRKATRTITQRNHDEIMVHADLSIVIRRVSASETEVRESQFFA